MCEIRFSFEKDLDISSTLVTKVQECSDFSNYNLRVQALRNIPVNILRSNPAMKYAPMYKLEGENYSIGFGYNSVFIDKKSLYVNFEEFEGIITKVFELLTTNETRFIKIEELRLKYVNLFPGSTLYQATKLNLRYNDYEIDQNSKATVNVEKKEKNDCSINITLINNAIVRNVENSNTINASVVDLDTVKDISKLDIHAFSDDALCKSLRELHDYIYREFCGLINEDYVNTKLGGWIE